MRTNASFITPITHLRFKSTVKDNTRQMERKEGNRTHTQRPKDKDRAPFQLATEQRTHWAKERTLGHCQSEGKGERRGDIKRQTKTFHYMFFGEE